MQRPVRAGLDAGNAERGRAHGARPRARTGAPSLFASSPSIRSRGSASALDVRRATDMPGRRPAIAPSVRIGDPRLPSWRTGMTLDENKAIVRRFVEEIFVGGRHETVDEL